MKGDTMLPLGSFEVKSGKLVVSDPCYKRDIWCAGTVKAVNGKWFAAVRQRNYPYVYNDRAGDDVRVRELLAWTAPVVWKGNQVYGGGVWDQLSFEVGVDSGQAGIFDNEAYQDNRYGRELLEAQTKAGKAHFDLKSAEVDAKPGYWYWAVCNLTVGEIPAGVLQGGVVSSSGFGDGGYRAFCRHKDDKVVALKIVFINAKEN